MQQLPEEERGIIEIQLWNALEEALDQFEQATLSQREAAHTKYLQAIENFTHFVAQSPIPSGEATAEGIQQGVA